jgi:hypothetical protein
MLTFKMSSGLMVLLTVNPCGHWAPFWRQAQGNSRGNSSSFRDDWLPVENMQTTNALRCAWESHETVDRVPADSISATASGIAITPTAGPRPTSTTSATSTVPSPARLRAAVNSQSAPVRPCTASPWPTSSTASPEAGRLLHPPPGPVTVKSRACSVSLSTRTRCARD